jgi:hypothetical protein
MLTGMGRQIVQVSAHSGTYAPTIYAEVPDNARSCKLRIIRGLSGTVAFLYNDLVLARFKMNTTNALVATVNTTATDFKSPLVVSYRSFHNQLGVMIGDTIITTAIVYSKDRLELVAPPDLVGPQDVSLFSRFALHARTTDLLTILLPPRVSLSGASGIEATVRNDPVLR